MTARGSTSRLLAGKVAAATGSTSGIGLGIAHSLAAAGADVMLNGSGAISSEIDDLREGLERTFDARTGYAQADARRPEQVLRLVQRTARELGAVDILVNNAGIQYIAPVHEFPVEKWDEIIAINLSAAFHAIRAVLPSMLERNWGRVINVASTHGLVASPQKVAYVAAKHGLVGLTKVVALETAATGLTCNAICPGWVLTPIVQKQIDARARSQSISVEEAKRDLLAEKQPSREFVRPEQVRVLNPGSNDFAPFSPSSKPDHSPESSGSSNPAGCASTSTIEKSEWLYELSGGSGAALEAGPPIFCIADAAIDERTAA
jgi:3-hydroxybutyrate dehydrogenase